MNPFNTLQQNSEQVSQGKRVLIYSLHYYPNFIGGAEVAIKEITDRIDSKDFQFDLICLKMDDTEKSFEKIGNVNVYRIGLTSHNIKVQKFLSKFNKYFIAISGLFKGLSLMRKNHYSLLWSMMATYNSFAAVLLKRINPKLPFLLTLQEGDPPKYIKRRARIAWPWFKDIFKKADHIQVISNFLGEFAKDMGYEGDITLVPNGVDFDFFSKKSDSGFPASPAGRSILDSREENDFVLFTSSRLVVKNNLGIVIEALAKLPERFKFVIAGRGDLEEKLKKQAKDLGLEDRVKFLGHINKEEIPAYQFMSDAFIRPSLSEGLGNSFIEAMASKLPVIASNRGGIVDFAHHGENALVIDPESVDEIVEAIKTLDEDKELRDKIIENAYQMVKEDYDWSKIAGEMKEIFEKTI
jgi:glycosyltransferase involved in cell wall biosynthesis